MSKVQYNRPITDEGYDEPLSRSGINARAIAGLALERGVSMYEPAGPDRTYPDEQYLSLLEQQPPTNKLYNNPQEEADARQAFAQKMAGFKNRMAGLNKLYPNVNTLTRSPYDALVFGPANNPAPFSAGPIRGDVFAPPPNNRFQSPSYR